MEQKTQNFIVEIDYREHKTIDDFRAHFTDVCVKTLDVGDYILTDKYTGKQVCYIERKTMADFIDTEIDTSRHKTYEKMHRINITNNIKTYCIILTKPKSRTTKKININKAINNISITYNIICILCKETELISTVQKIAGLNDTYTKYKSFNVEAIMPALIQHWNAIANVITSNILYYINLSHETYLFNMIKQKPETIINHKYILLCLIDALLILGIREDLRSLYDINNSYTFILEEPTLANPNPKEKPIKTIYNYAYNIWTALPGLSYKSVDKLIEKYSIYNIIVDKAEVDIKLTKIGRNTIDAMLLGSKYHERVILSQCPHISLFTASKILYEFSLIDILTDITVLYNFKVVKKRTITISKSMADNIYNILRYKK